jgi:hypothetical protein
MTGFKGLILLHTIMKLMSSMKTGKFLELLSDYQLLKQENYQVVHVIQKCAYKRFYILSVCVSNHP